MFLQISKTLLTLLLVGALGGRPLLAAHEEPNSGGKKAHPERPVDDDKEDEDEKLKGFGLPQKKFLEESKVPASIKEIAKVSVRQICVCKAGPEYCITAFSFKKGLFLTNEHAAQALDLEKTKAYYEKETGKKCPYDYVALDEKGQPVKIELSFAKRGKFKFEKKHMTSELWNPKTYYDKKTDEFDDHTEDLAVLKIEGIEATPLKLSTTFAKGDKVYHMGFPVRRETKSSDVLPAVSDGTIFEIGKINGEADFLGVNGTSGGPVVNGKGELVGVFWGKQRTSRESLLTFTRPGGTNWLEKNGYPRERSLFVPLNHVETFLKDVK